MKENKKFTLKEIEPTQECKEFIENSKGIFLSAEEDFRKDHEVLKPETYNFAKWFKQYKPEIPIKISQCENIVDLRSDEIWLPLYFLATDISLPLFLNFIYDYLKVMLRGSLAKDKPIAHLNVIYKEKDKFINVQYDGHIEGLKKINKIDINKIFDIQN